MPIPIQCPACKKSGLVPDDLAGRAVRCPQCRFKLRVPAKSPSGGMATSPIPPARMPTLKVDVLEDQEEIVEAKIDDSRTGRERSRHDPRPDPPISRRNLCPYCDSDARPVPRKSVSGVGVAVAVSSALVCFLMGFCTIITWFLVPFCFLFLLISNEYRICPDCGAKV